MQFSYSLVYIISSVLCLKEIVIDTPKTFESTINNAVEKTGGCGTYIFYMGNIDATSGESWCSDTRKALPLVIENLEKIQNSTVIKVMTGDRAGWKSPYNYYKYHQWANLTAIPVLTKFYADGPDFERLTEAECYDESKLKKYLGIN